MRGYAQKTLSHRTDLQRPPEKKERLARIPTPFLLASTFITALDIMKNIHIIDEHNEAFACIEDSFQEGVFNRPITLIHIDAHPDLDVPNTPISCYDRSVRKYLRCLNIGNFITPLILRNRINKVIYINIDDLNPTRKAVGSLNGEGKTIQYVQSAHFNSFFPDKKWFVQINSTDIKRLNEHVGKNPCVLDIDCDYFSSLYKYSVVNKSGRRLRKTLATNASKKWVELNIDFLTYYLDIKPRLTIVAKSVDSGYTPKQFETIILKRLLRKLNEEEPVPSQQTEPGFEGINPT